jgi:hypothetical protein
MILSAQEDDLAGTTTISGEQNSVSASIFRI